MMEATFAPDLSVLVTVVDAGASLTECLESLHSQVDAPALEILVPYDASVMGIDLLRRQFPSCRFLDIGSIATQRPVRSAAGQHELFDRRRSAGLRAATAPLVAIVEDRGIPRPDWARRVVELHRALPNAVIGGAIENGIDRPLNWAVYFCDFGRYQLPFAAGPRAYVSDVNICYKRNALEQTRELWTERYHETTVHWALQRSGEALYLASTCIVEQRRRDLTLRRCLSERIGWGRLFAYTRGRETTTAKRLAFAALAPALPFLLIGRIIRTQIAKRQPVGRLLTALPAAFALLLSWSLGELIGYLTGTP